MGFWAKRLHQKFSPGRKRYIGGVAAVRSVLYTKGSPAGLVFLQTHERTDLAIESLVMKPEWNNLFTDQDSEYGSLSSEDFKVAGKGEIAAVPIACTAPVISPTQPECRRSMPKP